MRHCTALFALLLATLAPATWGQSLLTPTPPGVDAAALAQLRPAMQRYVDDGSLAGMVTLVARQGTVVHLDAVGYQDREAGTPMPTDALFRLASMTKPIVSTAVLMLYDEGRFDLDDPIEAYLPALATLHVYAGTEGGGALSLERPTRPVTIRDLLTHTSGVASATFGATPVNALHREVDPLGTSQSLEEVVAKLATLPLQHQPGGAWTYGLSTDVLAHLVEVVSEQSLQQFLRERLFEPLGMRDTDYVVAEEAVDRFTTLYTHDQQGVLQRVGGPAENRFTRPPEFFRGNTGLVSTASDYAHFAQMLLSDGTLGDAQILRPETAVLMRTNHLTPAQLPMRVGAVDFPGAGYGFGLGLGVVIDPEAVPLPFSEGTVWWIGSTDTYFWIDPDRELIGILMTQLADLELHSFYPAFVQLVYAALTDEATPSPGGATRRRY